MGNSSSKSLDNILKNINMSPFPSYIISRIFSFLPPEYLEYFLWYLCGEELELWRGYAKQYMSTIIFDSKNCKNTFLQVYTNVSKVRKAFNLVLVLGKMGFAAQLSYGKFYFLTERRQYNFPVILVCGKLFRDKSTSSEKLFGISKNMSNKAFAKAFISKYNLKKNKKNQKGEYQEWLTKVMSLLSHWDYFRCNDPKRLICECPSRKEKCVSSDNFSLLVELGKFDSELDV